MLNINPSGQIQMAIGHLRDDVPTNIEEIINRYKSIDGTLFHHIISSPTCRYEKGYGAGRVPPHITQMNAEERFKNILTERCITGNPKSYFVNKHANSLTASQIDDIKSVSFALAPHSKVGDHFAARGSEYGIVFYHDFLEENGLRPVVYLNDHSDEEIGQIVYSSPYLVETYSKKYDMRWENEWRIKGKLKFTPDDVAFLIVPDAAYMAIYEWIERNVQEEDSFGCDYTLIPSSIFSDPLSYIYMAPVLQHQSWHQIRLYGGMLMDFDDFEPPTKEDRDYMNSDGGELLECLAKASLMEVYEQKYVQRFFKFVGSLDDKTKNTSMFHNIDKMKENAKEPWGSVRDLTILAYERLFEAQKGRITKHWYERDEE
ncbi:MULTISPECIES: hypothetical protein [Burkholderia]|uniref:hypothetical protein n=1 Tax=Burkholderia TaxID=32008 RepID=UPI00195CBCD5|nr:hypothetical protein [Burkholderia sp. MS389]CAG2308299.1 hypothetical protein BCCR75389_03454 [Burkholderia cenocepacia]QRR17160.1 hypothetical protein GJG85_27990 [Burkholderia sp. MS389]CAG2308329.1 hypothetical protein BCCR75384_03469 [Burkholderia cenocepacia]CAG2308368.1 hypothetical protein BCCR75386_03470 [Burkholderia cenocepacia]CAG2308389.1 hypothetical protein BCCR75387_03469 [Burkholderia cenocepacia]